ncbi:MULTISPECIES: SusC/RagA family TonB-linked outer membrane protein [unclassified Arcicella]|uniref:SusC/RagA family TonB-linked outer membrane protein n=1 Tax=unclassified Arcicella TaxID=2644986 RepID=UPI00285E790D|nr:MULTISPECIES: SusC/RagA family TonB-linked outer membrane protein [unclassified Arcicella]MDR6563802.1 TonB-linked SusC/RagA family outer membrane protein [Arcicella sp. BE51]MDR6813514.1 TonB-linked SusC/RagA family outer membrane protein [Arcicella sp. BE140]MDR6824827.1 TonB-linked SusC/RagA family outer membrane protein [Arcicella sp. BE139]
MKKIFLLLMLLMGNCAMLYAQRLKSRVLDATDAHPIQGASVRLVRAATGTITDANGSFEILRLSKYQADTLVISSIGFKTTVIAVDNRSLPESLLMNRQSFALDEVVVSTGYAKISRERATGSFTHISNELINRSISPDIISRLEGVTPALQFYRSTVTPKGTTSELRIRGVSSIFSDTAPLIVVDNFPYEGDINSINPNDIADITILKDAAAASIWGVRAGNGVIVINTKQGKYNQKTSVSLQSNITVGEKPNLFYNPSFLASQELIDFQRLRFQQGGFQQNNWTLLPEAIEIQIARQEGKLSAEEMERQLKHLATKGIRKEMLANLYQKSLNQQYAFNISGGNNSLKYITSLGFDKNLSGNVGFNSLRITLNNQFTYRFNQKLELFTSLYYALQHFSNNGLERTDLIPREGGAIQSYTSLRDENGMPTYIPYKYRQTYIAAAESQGLLNWQYNPLDELALSDKTSKNNETRINAGLRYALIPDLALEVKYQFRLAQGASRQYYSPQTYYVRDLVNRFTQANGTSVIPSGGILSGNQSSGDSHYGRVQLNYSRLFQPLHQLDALAGAEVRQDRSQSGPGYLLYGYDDQILTSAPYLNYETSYQLRPISSGRIPSPVNDIGYLTDRYLSYFANLAYTYDKKYTLSLSGRWDASNIFGVATNQKGVPLWSVGLLWNIKEEWMPDIESIDLLKLRATYGVNGNINKQVSALPNISLSSGVITNYPYARITTTGNPNLRWEKVVVWNMATDFSFFHNRIRGSLEYYEKAGIDLIGYDFLDPTTGIFQSPSGLYTIDNRINYANLLTKGVDLEINGAITTGKFKWSTVLMASWTQNKVTKYNAAEAPTLLSFLPASNAGRAPATQGKSVDILYALPWYGLNPTTGAMQVYDSKGGGAGTLSENYAAYWALLQQANLKEMGVTVPVFFGSIRNTFTWKGLSASVNMVYKAGYQFRRSSINYSNLINYGGGHRDYEARWRSPGDELHTAVPAVTLTANTTRDNIYLSNERLIENGAHLRLKDINLSYKLSATKLGLSNVSVFMYLNNVGILWRANKQGLDPDFPTSDYPPIRTYSLGFKIDI